MAEIKEEANGDGFIPGAPVIGVCVGKERRGIRALKWALQKVVPPQGCVYLLHVKSPVRWIPNPMGGKLPVEDVNPELVKQFKEDRMLDTRKLVDEYSRICDKNKVAWKLYYAENDSVQKELVDQISKLGITKLVLETSSQNAFTRALKKESISAYVAKHAPNFCAVMVISNGKLHSLKDATRSLSVHSSPRSSLSRASDVSTSTSIPNSEIIEDHSMASSGFQNVERDLQFQVKDDLCNTPHGRLIQSASMDVSRGFQLMSPNSEDQSPASNLMMRNYSDRPLNRFPQSASFHQEPWSRLDYWSMPAKDNAFSIGELEGRASDVDPVEESSPDNNSQGPEFSTPPRMPLEDLDGPSTSLAAYGSIDRTMDLSEMVLYPNCDTLSQTGIGLGKSTTSSSLEEVSLQTLLHKQGSTLMVSNTAVSRNEVPPADLLQSQLNEAKQAAYWAHREAERQANDFRIAEGVVARARKMIVECERQREEALNEAKLAIQKVSDYEKRCEEAVATAQAALRDQHILQERLAEEIRTHQETQNELENQTRRIESYVIAADLANQQVQAERSRCEGALLELEEVTRKLAEECQLRKEAEERASQEASAKREAVVALRKEQQKYSEYSFQELQSATNNFHEENKLGQGGYGPVFKGKLHHTTVAIKVLAREGLQGRGEFQKEVELLSHIHHPHMVMLRGACPEKGCIVYEYMANGSLEDRLNCRDGTPPLPWYVRFRICLEVATALLFLHSRPQPIVHRDLKPGNILLDHHFVSKISDVGLAKLVPNNLTFSVTMYKESMLVGTFAYIDPDYQRTGVVSCESDVYSLGIVMLQLLTGQPAVGVVHLVEEAVDKGQLVDVLDKSAGEWPVREAMVLACLGLQCAEPRRKNRPNLETKILPELETVQSVANIEAANMACVGPSSSPGKMPIVPGSFFCPILQEIMENPHLAADGFTYEYDSIKIWLQDHNTSPMTNLVLAHNNLIPNLSLRSAIKEWYDNGLR